MNLYFANHIICSEECYREYVKSTFRKSVQAIILICAVVLAVFAVIYVMIGKMGWFLFFTLFSVFMFCYPSILRGVLIKRGYNQQLLLNNGRPREVTTEFSDRIHLISSNKGESYFDYAQITQICETKNMILLVVKHSVAIVVAKNGFLLGDMGNFQQFIRQRCPYAKYTYR
ncbi:MAG: YcxB family protein [Oscillospiraceae bacterium]|jgi:hypothetical protein|nr:YcxB family protein [Oscillospiraceae bacterium]MDD3260839.1 YcxB family protein [Oscillospiraceae bacterium]